MAPERIEEARREIADADAAFGTIPPDLLATARKLRWLQAPAIAPPAGYYSAELVAHPAVVTNFRGIFNEHIAAHIMAFVLAFARGFHRVTSVGALCWPSSSANVPGIRVYGLRSSDAPV
ncbi:MAG: hypothetical protein M3336_16845 [Chloroflexota bacterium]|nr:hypothetical protein [Chloroflexota bacterium]